MNNPTKRALALTLTIPMLLGVASCSASGNSTTDTGTTAGSGTTTTTETENAVALEDESVNPNDNTSDQSGELRSGLSVSGLILPSGWENATPVWDVASVQHDMSQEQRLFAKDRVILVAPTEEDQYKIVIVNTTNGQTIFNDQVDMYNGWIPASITEVDGVEYLNILQIFDQASDSALTKSTEMARLGYIDLGSEKPEYKQTELAVNGIDIETSIENDHVLASDNDGYPYIRSTMPGKEDGDDANSYIFVYPAGKELVRTDKEHRDSKLLGLSNGKPIKLSSNYGFNKLVTVGDYNLTKKTGEQHLDTIYHVDYPYILAGDLLMDNLYFVDMEKEEVVIHRVHPDDADTNEEQREAKHFRISDNRKYAVIGALVIDLEKKKIHDLGETSTQERTSFHYISDDGIAYGKAIEDTVFVTYDIKTQEQETVTKDSSFTFSSVREILDDGSILVENDHGVAVLKK